MIKKNCNRQQRTTVNNPYTQTEHDKGEFKFKSIGPTGVMNMFKIVDVKLLCICNHEQASCTKIQIHVTHFNTEDSVAQTGAEHIHLGARSV